MIHYIHHQLQTKLPLLVYCQWNVLLNQAGINSIPLFSTRPIHSSLIRFVKLSVVSRVDHNFEGLCNQFLEKGRFNIVDDVKDLALELQ